MRMTVVGGYLGAGKTSWLRHQRALGRYAGAAILVNEAALTPVDDALLGGVFRTLAGGCACCEGKEALLDALRALADLVASGKGTEEVVLETSGLADPAALMAVVAGDPVLCHHIRFAPLIVLIDGLNGLAQLQSEALVRRQVEAADHLVVTKADLAEPAALASLLATLRALNPQAGLVTAVRGEETAVSEPLTAAPAVLPDTQELSLPKAFALTLPEQTEWSAFAVWLSALLHARGDELVRVKGVVRTPAGRLLLQAVRRSVERPEILPPSIAAEDNSMVFIGRNLNPQILQASFNRFVLGR